MSEWISVEDRYPTEDDGLVWIYCGWSKSVSDAPFEWYMVNEHDGDEYWMPTGLKKPEPPK